MNNGNININDDGASCPEGAPSSPSTPTSEWTNAAILFEEREKALGHIRVLSTKREKNVEYVLNDEALAHLRLIFDKYLEVPSLLDHHIVELVGTLTDAACSLMSTTATGNITYCDGKSDDEIETGSEDSKCDDEYHRFWNSPLPRILSAIYALSKVRGRKRVQKFLPHQVEHLEAVLDCLIMLDRLAIQQKTPQNNGSAIDHGNRSETIGGPELWESTYTMWNWMEILGKMPFDCEVVIDESQITEFFRLGSSHLSETGPTREMAASCLARWLARPDLENSAFRISFQEWSLGVLEEYVGMGRSRTKESTTDNPTHSSVRSDIFTTMGVMRTLVTILKISTAQRHKVLASMEPYWSILRNLSQFTNQPSNFLLRKYMVKWWTRLGVLYLPPRIASWRYQRGRRSLKENLQRQQLQQQKQSLTTPTAAANKAFNEDLPPDPRHSKDYFFFVPDQVEMAMGLVLASLKDSTTAVRWSAAKGVGRLTSRLPAICAEDVINAILELFNDVENDNDWHGACLTLAELARRGLLLPHRLKDVIPNIVKAIHYDIPRHRTSVGSHVRDAACYTYWALARAYSPNILRPFIPQLGQSIVVAFLFDREVNCRRAASAAFQEMVGRQGAQNFQNGISILTAADYFSLGNRKDAYTTIALHVAQYEEYQIAIINNLYQVTLAHWDPAIRLLASQSLKKLTALNPQHMVDEVLPYLLDKCLDEKNLQLRHGATLGLAEIVLALGEIDTNDNLLPSQLLELIAQIVPAIEKKRLYRGRGGEQMRAAVCRLIECLSLSCIPLRVPQQVRLLDSVDACLPHPNEMIQEQAGNALFALTRSYFPVGSKGPSARLQSRVVDKYTKTARTSINPAATRGFSLALGCLPAKILAPSSEVLDITLSCLCRVSHPNAKVGKEKDAETRRNALVSLSRVCQTVGLLPVDDESQRVVPLSIQQIKRVFAAYMRAMGDYNTDKRGDVGSKCRLAAMNGLVDLATSITSQNYGEGGDSEIFSIELCTQIMGLLLKQFSEKLNFVRAEAAKCILALLDNENPVRIFISKRKTLLDALSPPNLTGHLTYESLNWADASVTYQMVVKAAEIDEYFGYVISGLILSTGGLTKSITENSSQALIQWARGADDMKIDRLGRGKTQTWKE